MYLLLVQKRDLSKVQVNILQLIFPISQIFDGHSIRSFQQFCHEPKNKNKQTNTKIIVCLEMEEIRNSLHNYHKKLNKFERDTEATIAVAGKSEYNCSLVGCLK